MKLAGLNVRLISRAVEKAWCTRVNVREKKKEPRPGLFAVQVTDLEKGPVHIKEQVPLERLKERLQYCEYDVQAESASVDIILELCNPGVLTKGTVTADIRAQCGICLAETVFHLSSDVSTFICKRPETDTDESSIEITPEDLEREWFDGNTVILDELLLDSIVLEIPMNPKCGDSCPGLLTTFINDEPKERIDPRLAPLASIRLEKER